MFWDIAFANSLLKIPLACNAKLIDKNLLWIDTIKMMQKDVLYEQHFKEQTPKTWGRIHKRYNAKLTGIL